MKKLLTIAVAAFAITAVNAAYNAQQVGVTTISATSQNTIIPVPFTSLTNSSTSVTAKDLVKTTGLNEGTWLLYFDGATYNVWRLSSSKSWEPGTYSTIPGATVSPAAENLTVSAGGAMWVVLPSAPDGSVNITVYGTYVNQTSSTVAAGTTMLVANPLQSNATIATSGAVKGDKITFIANGVPTVYTYNNAGQWVTLTDNGGELIATPISTIPLGAGFWCKASTSAITITWTPAAGS